MNGSAQRRSSSLHVFRVGVFFLRRAVSVGFKSLWQHRLRSLLTMLGIVFGVSSVIAMLAVGEGASHEAQEQIRQQGSNNILLRSVKPPEDDRGAQGSTWMIEYGLTSKDLQRIRNTIPSVRVVVPGRIIRKKVWNVGYRVDCDIVGTVPWYPEMRNHQVASGRFFTDAEMERGSSVCVLGSEMVGDLFPRTAAIGQSVRVASNYYHVIGVMKPLQTLGTEAKGEAAGQIDTGKSRVYIPMSTARNHFGETLVRRSSGSFSVERVEYHEVAVQVERLEEVIETSLIIADLLAFHHKKKDYEMQVPLELLRRAEETARIFNIVLGAIAGISLLVGGIGIMNIMLASVTERTREIGVRRAVGAKRKDIVMQFLIETVILSGIGGLIGVVLGVSVPFIITAATGQDTIITWWSPVIAFTISAVVGVIFGLYPATRAAHMDPVEALRHE